MLIIKCQCGEDALPSNWFVKGIGRLWYCFSCQLYLDENGKQISSEILMNKYSSVSLV